MSQIDFKKVQGPRINRKLETQIKDFITTLASNLNSEHDFNFKTQDTLFFSQEGLGTLFLNGQEAKEFRELVWSVIKVICSTNLVSRKFVEKSLQTTILEALDIEEKRADISFDRRLDQAVQKLRSTFSQNPSEFQFYYPVHGLDQSGLPFKIGPVEFFVFQENILDEINLKKKEEYSSVENEAIDFSVKGFKVPERFGMIYAKVKVLAIDNEAAEEIAINELHSVLELLNFFIGFVPYANELFLYLPGEASSEEVLYTIRELNKNSVAYTGLKVAGPYSVIPINKFLDIDEKFNMGFKKVCQLLLEKPNSLQDRLLSAMRWVGRGRVNQSLKQNEQAFLFYTIALESVVLLDGDNEELGYRLRVRLGHLLGKSEEYRPVVASQVKALYAIRSKIVHSGYFKVTDSEVNIIRSIVSNCLIRLLRDEPFASMKDSKDLVTWFEQQIYR